MSVRITIRNESATQGGMHNSSPELLDGLCRYPPDWYEVIEHLDPIRCLVSDELFGTVSPNKGAVAQSVRAADS